MEFVRGITESAADRAIVKSIVTIAKSLGMQTIGEGVEDEETLRLPAPRSASTTPRATTWAARSRSVRRLDERADDRALPCDKLQAMLIYSMGVSVDGYIADREGGFDWTVPSDELFRFHLARVSELGGYLLGRRLYETMLVWETDPSMRVDDLRSAFADVWCAIPKVVFSRTLDSVQGNARLAEASVAEEAAAALDATDKDVGIGGAGLAAAAVELGLVDELRMFRYPVAVGGGTPFLPPVTEDISLELRETRTFGSRVIYERYERARRP